MTYRSIFSKAALAALISLCLLYFTHNQSVPTFLYNTILLYAALHVPSITVVPRKRLVIAAVGTAVFVLIMFVVKTQTPRFFMAHANLMVVPFAFFINSYMWNFPEESMGKSQHMFNLGIIAYGVAVIITSTDYLLLISAQLPQLTLTETIEAIIAVQGALLLFHLLLAINPGPSEKVNTRIYILLIAASLICCVLYTLKSNMYVAVSLPVAINLLIVLVSMTLLAKYPAKRLIFSYVTVLDMLLTLYLLISGILIALNQ